MSESAVVSPAVSSAGAQITITLPDGSQKATAAGTTVSEFVRTSIGAGLAKAALFARFDGQDIDLARKLERDGKLQIFTSKQAESLDLVRHDAAHIVASVVQRLYPGTQVTIGPTIEDGFYYDFHKATPFTPDDLVKIEAAANEEVKKDHPFVRKEVSKEEALALFKGMGETFKVEIVEDIFAKGAKTLTLYSHGDWVDFCLGPHGPSTGRVGVIKLLSTSAAYWRGDHTKAALQRIYGTAFFDKKDLDAWVRQQEEAKKRDHRKLGKELDLFAFHPFAPGATFWFAKGTELYTTLQGAMRNLTKRNGYVEVKTPLMFNKGLWEISGHWGKYRENMFLVLDPEASVQQAEGAPPKSAAQEIDERASFSLKPMNCPSHHLMYQMKRHSYRELPIRYHTQDPLHRNEATGVLSGLTRVRQFQQDDAHIYLMESQITDEVKALTAMIQKVYTAFGLTFTAKFATRPEKRLGDDAMWDRAEGALRAALEATGLQYELKPGDGAFYGPKIDFDVSDSIGRKWQLGTIQLDYAAPERFDLSYIGDDNAQHRPVVIHRAIYGSFERFIAILIEHFAGAFPTWLAPVQARIITVADRHEAWARTVLEALQGLGLRVDLDASSDKLGAKIRSAQLEKIPYTLVIGDAEVEKKGVAPRARGEGKAAELPAMTLEDFSAHIAKDAKVPF
ncbi:MAG: threonine--tRNA ligase [Deltaproteobacteria bacterium]|nr:threonine--tRNA ligase [Deltaproteobacteria bacterium]